MRADLYRLRRSLREVFNLGFFAGPPEPQVTQANDEGDIDLTLRVEEKSAGQFRVGAGFSQLNRVSGFIGITEPNFLGRGYRVSGNWEFARSRQDVSLSFTQPWAFGTPTELSVSVYAANQDRVEYLLKLIGQPRVIDFGQEGMKQWRPNAKFPFDTARLRNVIDLAARQSGWARKKPGAGRALGIAAHRSFLSYIAAVVEVETGSDGAIRIPRVDIAVDAGRLINPDRVRSQFEGAAVFGTSIALMSELTAAGLSPFAALAAGTTVAAAFLGEEDEFGAVREGLRADLLLLRGNPLADVRAASDPVGVMVNGDWYFGAALDALGGNPVREVSE